MTWFAVVDDETGGWAIGNRNVPTSQYVRKLDSSDRVLADFMSERDARWVARALNQYERWLSVHPAANVDPL